MRVTLLFSSTHNSGLPKPSLGASRSGLQGGGGYLGIPRCAVRIGGGEGPELVQGRVEVAPELQRMEALIERLEFLAARRARGRRRRRAG